MKRKYQRDPEQVRQLLEWLGARLLHDGPDRGIELSHKVVREIVAILSALPEGKIARPKAWSYDVEMRAIFDMLDGKSVKDTAQWIVEETGQKVETAERRLWALRETPRFKNWRQKR